MYTKGHSFSLNDCMQITERARERYRHAVKCVRYIIRNKTKLGDPPNDYTATHKNLHCRKQIACRCNNIVVVVGLVVVVVEMNMI